MFCVTDIKLVSGYVPAPSSGLTSNERGSSAWQSSGHGSGTKSRDYHEQASSGHWSGRPSASLHQQVPSGRSEWPSRPSGSTSGVASGSSFMSSATNILMGMGVASGSGASSSRDSRFDGYKASVGSAARRY